MRAPRTLLLTFLLVLLSCGGETPMTPDPDPDPPAVASVVVTPNSGSVEVGRTQALGAETQDAAGNVLSGRSVAWSSGDDGVATVSASGVVTGVAVGTVTVTATSEGVSGSATVTVTQVPVASVVLSPDSLSLEVSDTASFSAVARDSSDNALSGREVRWSSGDPAIASVDSISGVVTAVAAGVVTITATSEGVSAMGQVRVSVPPPLGPVMRTWRSDAGSTDWEDGSNWMPSGVPAATDSVRVVAGPLQPITSQNHTVAWLKVEPAASLDLDGNEVTVTGDVDGGTNSITRGTVRLTGTGLIEGSLPSVIVSGSYALSGAASLTGELVIDGGGANLTVGAETIMVEGNLTVTGAVMTMQDAAGVMDINGDARFFGGPSTDGLLTAGTLRVAGDFTQTAGASFSPFAASGTHVTVFDGAGPQTLNFSSGGLNPGSTRFNSVVVEGGDVSIIGTMAVLGDFEVTSTATIDGTGTLVVQGALTTTVGSTMAPAVVELGGSMAVSGTFNPPTTEFTGSGQSIQGGLGYQTVRVEGTASLGGTTTLAGQLIVDSGGNLSVGAETITVAGSLTVTGSLMTMQDAAGVMDINGDARFFGGPSTDGLLTAGTLRVAGDFTQTAGASFAPFAASGVHVTVFDGAGPQTANFGSGGTAASSAHFAGLTIEGGDVSIVGTMAVNGDLDVTSTATVDGTGTLVVQGALTTTVGSTIAPAVVELGGSMAVSGTFSPPTTEFTGSAQSIQGGLGYQTVRVEGTASLGGTTSLTGQLIVDSGGNLSVGAETITVAGSLTVTGSLMTMQDAAGVMDINGDARFFGGPSTDGLLTAGTLRVAGDFTQTAGASFAPFAASGAHLTVFDGTGPQTANFGSGGTAASSTHFAGLSIEGGDVSIVGTMAVNGDLNVGAAVTVDGSGNLIVQGTLTTVSGSTISPAVVELDGAMAVSGTFSPAMTEFTGTGQSIQAGLSYQSVRVEGTSSLGGTTSLTGELVINGGGANLTVGAETITVAGSLTVTGAVMTMQDAAGVMDINGDARFFGGPSTDGLLTAGTLRVAGDFTQTAGASFSPFAATGAHLTVFDGAGPQTVNFSSPGTNSSTSHFAALTISGADVSFTSDVVALSDWVLSGALTVGSDFDIFGNATLESGASLVNDGDISLTGTCTDNGATVTGTGTGNQACITP